VYQVEVETTFAAAHALRNYKGGLEPLHGHNFRVRVMLSGTQLDPAGMVIDFVDVKAALDRATQRYEHRNLNEVAPFDVESPSSENLARLIYEDLRGILQTQISQGVVIDEVRVWETNFSGAAYRPK
jgi:6-pyruvoyltetrahydropterin/6-carboxytetrahydropterin synthase